MDWLATALRVPKEEAAAALEEFRPVVVNAPAPVPAPVPAKVDLHDLPAEVIRWICVFLVVFASIRSFAYVFDWFVRMDNAVLSAFMASIITVAGMTFPQVSIQLIKEKKRILSGLVLLLSVAIIGFSMLTTLAGIYNARTGSMETKIDLVEVAKVEKKKEGDLQRLENDAEVLRGQIAKLAPEDWRQYQLNKDLAAIRAEVSKLRDGEKPKDLTVKRKDFFGWAEGVTGFRADFLEFLFALIPALIIDLLGPIALAIVLFLGEKKNVR